MNAAGDDRQPVRPVVDGVHARQHREQYLRRANIRGRLFATNVLFARLQREPKSALAVGIDRYSNQSARQIALEFVASGEECGVRTAETHRHAEALARSHDHVGIPFAGWSQQRQREQVGGGDHQRAFGVDGFGERAIVAHVAIGARVLYQRRKTIRIGRRHRGPHVKRNAEWLRAGSDDVDGLRQHIVRDVDRHAPAFPRALAKCHRLRRRGRFVEHRRIRDGHAAQVADHGLKVEHGFEAALRNFRLVRCVRGVPRGVLENIAQDHARRVGAVIALADEGLEHAILGRKLLQLMQRLFLTLGCRERQRRALTYRGRHDGVDQRGAGGVAKQLEHRCLLLVAGADVAVDETAVLLERGQRNSGRRRGAIGLIQFHRRLIPHRRPRYKPPHRAGTQHRRRSPASACRANARMHRR